MAVVIDEFEVVANEEEGSQTTGPAVTSNAAGSPTVHELETIVERQWDRYERVWAH